MFFSVLIIFLSDVLFPGSDISVQVPPFLSGVQFPVSKADANLESISEFGPIKDKFSVRVRKNNDSEYIGRCF